jgi:hypothetical protein
VINPCGNQSAQVVWQLGCISLWDGDPERTVTTRTSTVTGQAARRSTMGARSVATRPNRGPGTDPLNYYAPRNLFTNAFAPNVCEQQNNNSGDGMVLLTATVSLPGCPQQGCQALACITVTPP